MKEVRVNRVTITVPEWNQSNHGHTSYSMEFTTPYECIPALERKCEKEGWSLKFNATEIMMSPDMIVHHVKNAGKKVR